MSSIPLRVIPNTKSDTMIVRCTCSLHVCSGPMIQCSRCGCWSHKKCVTAVTPFTCSFCSIMAERMLYTRFNKSATSTGLIVDHVPLKNSIVGRLTPIQICEVREHSLACGHSCELLNKLAMFISASEMQISQTERILSQMRACDPIRDQLSEEIQSKKKLLIRHSEIFMRLAEELRSAKREQLVVPTLRDAIVNELL